MDEALELGPELSPGDLNCIDDVTPLVPFVARPLGSGFELMTEPFLLLRRCS